MRMRGRKDRSPSTFDSNFFSFFLSRSFLIFLQKIWFNAPKCVLFGTKLRAMIKYGSHITATILEASTFAISLFSSTLPPPDLIFQTTLSPRHLPPLFSQYYHPKCSPNPRRGPQRDPAHSPSNLFQLPAISVKSSNCTDGEGFK